MNRAALIPLAVGVLVIFATGVAVKQGWIDEAWANSVISFTLGGGVIGGAVGGTTAYRMGQRNDADLDSFRTRARAIRETRNNAIRGSDAVDHVLAMERLVTDLAGPEE
jgi:hypothetical protein